MGVTMQVPHDAVLLRIFFGEDDKLGHLPLYEAIVLKAREMHLAGATVLRGPMGFGKSSRLHTAKILRLSMDLPLVIEIIDNGIGFAKNSTRAFSNGLYNMQKRMNDIGGSLEITSAEGTVITLTCPLAL